MKIETEQDFQRLVEEVAELQNQVLNLEAMVFSTIRPQAQLVQKYKEFKTNYERKYKLYQKFKERF